MVDDNDLNTKYTIKNGDSYENISEADIVNDGGTKVLRLNTFLNTYKMTDGLTEEDANYPVVKSIGKVPQNSKVRIDLELKMSPRVSFYLHHSKPNHTDWRIWRFEGNNGSTHKIKVLYNTDTGKIPVCNIYNKHTVIMDTATGAMKVYLNGDFIWETSTEKIGRAPAWGQELFFRHITNTSESYKPVITYNAEDNTKIESVKNPQYVYVKSLKMTTYSDTALESVTPADGSSVATPTEAVFTFNNEIKSVEEATIYPSDGDAVAVDVSSLVIDGKTVKVPYLFKDNVDYIVELGGVSDGATSTDASTSFKAEAWSYKYIGNPVVSSVDNNTYFVNEDFTNSDDTNIITADNKHSAWSFAWKNDIVPETAIVENGKEGKGFQVTAGHELRINFKKNTYLDSTTAVSYDVFLGANTKQFIFGRDDYYKIIEVDPETKVETVISKGNAYPVVAAWEYGYYNYNENAQSTAPMTLGEWHKVFVTISDTAGTTIYVDGEVVHNIPKPSTYSGLSATNFFSIKASGDNVILDNLKIYLDGNATALTAVSPAYDGTATASSPLEFTYSEIIGDASGATLIVKPADTNEAVTLTNGNGMSVNVENNTVKLILDDALAAGNYGVELSGLKDAYGSAVGAVRTRFTTTADAEWTMTDVEETTVEPKTKRYSFKVKHQGDAAAAQMVVAVYNYEGTLSSVVVCDPVSVDSDWTDLSAAAEYGAGKDTKIFLWNSTNGMNPIISAIEK
ncbi:MAG: hypothetical protein UH081_07435 [Clostridia bacterium]|nr:hypothetical protein [Clostridia bacterium]